MICALSHSHSFALFCRHGGEVFRQPRRQGQHPLTAAARCPAMKRSAVRTINLEVDN